MYICHAVVGLEKKEMKFRVVQSHIELYTVPYLAYV